MDKPLRLVSSDAPGVAEAARSFEAFFEAESRTLFRRLWLVTGNRAEAEEIMQDSFPKLWERWDRVRQVDDPTSYLYRTAMNVFRRRYQRGVMAVKRAVGVGPGVDEFAAADERHVVREILAKLSPRQPGPRVQPQPAHIALINVDGTDIVEITSGPDFDYRPTWSPDSSRIAFERSFVDGSDAIFIVNRDGSGLTRILDGVCCMDPAWSPDGGRLSFWNTTDQVLQTLDLVTKKVTTIATAAQLGGGPFDDPFTGWSPDARWVALGGCCENLSSLYLVAVDGSAALLVPNTQDGTAPAWQPAA